MTEPTRFLKIGNGLSGTEDTLKIMRQLVMAGKKDPVIRQFTAHLVQPLPQKDRLGEVKKVHEFVRDHIRYLWDVNGVETVQTPRYTLENGHGDCDDKTVLVCSMLESIGHKTRMIAAGANPFSCSHVFPQVLLYTRQGPKWVTVETTEQVGLGWTMPNIQIKRVIHNR